MIITCPECATRYDVDDDRFSPDGRSVRCSACGESWFVPAPELLEMTPLDSEEDEAAPAARRKAASSAKGGASKTAKTRSAAKKSASKDAPPDEDDNDAEERPRIKVGFAESEEAEDRTSSPRARRAAARLMEKGDDDDDAGKAPTSSRRKTKAKASSRDDLCTEDVEDDDGDDSLFEEPVRKKASSARRRSDDEDDDEPVEKGWRKGKRFIVEDDEDEAEHRPFFSRKRNAKSVRDDRRRGGETLRFTDNDAQADARDDDEDDGYHEAGGAYVVDADWEDIDDPDGARPRGFGRKIRAERRRATALARMEDVRPLNPDTFDEEFFAALRVTPQELERAIRKARRRAEAREKNRLTPLRVFGWTAWAALVAGALYAMFVYRNEIVKVAPKTADAYAVIGIDANPYGLAIENVRHRLAMSTGGPTIEITGTLRNQTAGSVAAPLLQAEALGARGELLARWTFTADETDVEEGAEVAFVTRAPAPDGVAEVALSFAPERSVLDTILPGGDE